MHVLPSSATDGQLKSFWLSIDTDGSGWISCGEFGAFMRRGEHVLNPARSWKEHLEASKRQSAESVRAERGAHALPAKGQHNTPAASDELVSALSTLCNQRLDRAVEMDEHETPAHIWFGLFKRIDTEQSGKMSFQQWAGLVRQTLGIGEDHITSRDLRSVWTSLDTHGTGAINAGEYAAFMRRGASKVDRPMASDKRMRILLARKRRAAAVREQDQQLAMQKQLMEQHDKQVRQVAARAVREQGRQVVAKVKEEVAAEKKAAYTAVVRRADQSDLKEQLKKAPVASTEQVVALAEACNRQLLAASDEGSTVFREAPTAPWFRLFKSVDRDGSGQISFDEFVKLLRHDLKLEGLGFDRDTLMATWVAMDVDGSGYISCGEFGKFMRRGMHVLPQPELTWQERMDKKARDAKAARAADKVRLFKGHVRRELENATPCNDDDVRQLSEHFNARLAEMRNAASAQNIAAAANGPLAASTQYGMWYALFKSVDENTNGYISYTELRGMVRHELGLPPSNVGEAVLRALWKALDKEDTGLLTAGDFLQFMRLGDPTGGIKPSLQSVRRQLGQEQRRAYEERQQRVQREHLDKLRRDATEAEKRAERLEREFYAEVAAVAAAENDASYVPPVERNAALLSTEVDAGMRVRPSADHLPKHQLMTTNFNKELAAGQKKARKRATRTAYATAGAATYGTSSQASSTSTSSAAAKASRHMSGSISEGALLKLPAIK